MTKQELIDKIVEIKQLVLDTEGNDNFDDDNLARINQICSDIELEWKIENAKCLESND